VDSRATILSVAKTHSWFTRIPCDFQTEQFRCARRKMCFYNASAIQHCKLCKYWHWRTPVFCQRGWSRNL